MDTYIHKVTWTFDYVVLRNHLTKLNHYIPTTTVPMGSKFDRMLTYLQRLPPIKWLKPLVMWSCKITRKSKIIISPLPKSLWPLNLKGWWVTSRLLWYSHMNFNLVSLLNYMTIWRIYISTFTRFVTTTLGMVLNTRRRFSTQTLKS